MTHLFAVPVAIVLFACSFLMEVSAQPGGDQLLVLAIATIAIVAAILFAPARDPVNSDWLKAMLSDAALVTAILMVAVLASRADRIDFVSLLRVATICFLLILVCMSSLAALGCKVARNRQFLVLIFVALLATPVWLAPMAEIFADEPWIASFVVAASPLSAFAAALEIDFLRTGWFYEYSVLGSLRYSYPTWTSYTLVLFILAILTLMPILLLQRRRTTL